MQTHISVRGGGDGGKRCEAGTCRIRGLRQAVGIGLTNFGLRLVPLSDGLNPEFTSIQLRHSLARTTHCWSLGCKTSNFRLVLRLTFAASVLLNGLTDKAAIAALAPASSLFFPAPSTI